MHGAEKGATLLIANHRLQTGATKTS